MADPIGLSTIRNGISSIGSAVGAPGKTTGAAEASKSFADTLASAMSEINQSQNDANQAVTALAAGEPVDLHDVMLAQEQASLTFQLGVQTRNKLVEAYQEVMRMQV